MAFTSSRYIYIAIGILLGVGSIASTLFVCVLVGIALSFHILTTQNITRRTYGGFLLAWLIKSAAAISWFWSTYPIDWLAIPAGTLQLLFVAVYWLTTALWISVGGLSLVFLVWLTKRFFTAHYLVLLPLFPFFWLVSELVGSLSFAFFTIGEGGTINAQFSFGYVGNLLAEHHLLLQLAMFGGVYMLTLVTVALGTALWYGQSYIWPRYHYLSAALLLVLLCSATLSFNKDGDEVVDGYTVAIVNTWFENTLLKTPEGTTVRENQLAAAVAAALTLAPDYVALPEDARFFNQTQASSLTNSFFQFQFQNPSSVIVDSGRVVEGELPVLQAYVYDGQTKQEYQSQKRYLVPQGEFMPALYAKALRGIGFGEMVDTVAKDVSYRVGSKTSQSLFPAHLPGILFCFESVSPLGVRTIMKERQNQVPFIVHPISHGWFHDPQIFWHQLESMLKVQAVWNNIDIVSAGNHVTGIRVTKNGDIVRPTEIHRGDYWSVSEVVVPKR